MGWLERVKQKASALQGETLALMLAYRHPSVPWYAKAWAALVVAYAFSPIDLIPDFIPLLGYLDDLILLPLGIGIAVKLIPAAVMTECRQQAQTHLAQSNPGKWQGTLIIITLWILGLVLVGWLVMRLISG